MGKAFLVTFQNQKRQTPRRKALCPRDLEEEKFLKDFAASPLTLHLPNLVCLIAFYSTPAIPLFGGKDGEVYFVCFIRK